MLIET